MLSAGFFCNRQRRPEAAPRAALADHKQELTAMESRDEDDEAGSH